MSSKKSSYLATKVIDHVCNKAAYTAPATLYLALYTSDPTKADVGTEVAGGSYARKSITLGSSSGGEIASTNSQAFTSMPATTVTHWGIRDASSGGNLLYFGSFDIPVAVTGGSTFTVASGDLTIKEE